jgi:RNA polymerase-binding protein DksA
MAKTKSGSSAKRQARSPKRAAKAKTPAAKAAKPAARPRPARRRVQLDRKALATIRQNLLEMKGELDEELKEIEEAAFNVSQSEMSGEVGYDEDYADAGSFTFEREKDLSIANNIQDLLAKITRSVEKIDEGTYGICESCGQPIEPARLKVLPHALLCVRCKTAEERR